LLDVGEPLDALILEVGPGALEGEETSGLLSSLGESGLQILGQLGESDVPWGVQHLSSLGVVECWLLSNEEEDEAVTLL
jgi:hypothetical protein